jgi:catechol 2,3-dioxygenase-like lactoylglutathione lyase family enzyme
MSQVRRFDHVGITVADLDAVTAFFVGLGLEVENRMFLEGEFLDTVIGIPDSRTEIVMMQPPDGGTRLELSSFARPDPPARFAGRPRQRAGIAQRGL